MKNLLKEFKMYLAEKLVYWATCIEPGVVLRIHSVVTNGIKFVEPVTEIEKLKNAIRTLANNHGWKFKKENEKSNMFSFTKESGNGTKDFKIDVYYKNNSTMLNFNFTIATSIDHPVKGKTQMFRKGVSRNLFIKILINPRHHTDCGYRKK